MQSLKTFPTYLKEKLEQGSVAFSSPCSFLLNKELYDHSLFTLMPIEVNLYFLQVYNSVYPHVMRYENQFKLKKDEKLYVFGSNEHSVLGLDWSTRKQQEASFFMRPRLFNVNLGSPFKQVQCGFTFTMFLTENGKVYVCGRNLVGIGLKMKDGTEDVERLTQVIFPEEEFIKKIACNSSTMFAIPKHKTKRASPIVYGWGLGVKFNFGEVKKNYDTPEAFPVPFEVENIACNERMTLFIHQDKNQFQYRGYYLWTENPHKGMSEVFNLQPFEFINEIHISSEFFLIETIKILFSTDGKATTVKSFIQMGENFFSQGGYCHISFLDSHLQDLKMANCNFLNCYFLMENGQVLRAERERKGRLFNQDKGLELVDMFYGKKIDKIFQSENAFFAIEKKEGPKSMFVWGVNEKNFGWIPNTIRKYFKTPTEWRDDDFVGRIQDLFSGPFSRHCFLVVQDEPKKEKKRNKNSESTNKKQKS